MSKFRQHRDSVDTKNTRHFSSTQENKVAKVMNGRTVANSGAGAYSKGDINVGDMSGWLVECKTKVKDVDSFTVQKKWFEKNIEESIYMKKEHSVVVFSFGPSSKNYYILDEATFLEMKEALEEKRLRDGL